MQFGNFEYMKAISQKISDCGLRNDKSTKNSLRENYIHRIFGIPSKLLHISFASPKIKIQVPKLNPQQQNKNFYLAKLSHG
jgi:hypothetical protein